MIGAGAAGMMCAAQAGQRGRRVVLIDHVATIGEKIRISGGGRCNFTNVNASPAQYLSRQPAYCADALSRFAAADFVALVERHRAIERHQPPSPRNRERQEVDVGQLPGTMDARGIDGLRIEKAHFIGPELVVRVRCRLAQALGDHIHRKGIGITGLRYHANEAVLCEGTARPAIARIRLEPASGRFMERVVRIEQRDEDVHVQQRAHQ